MLYNRISYKGHVFNHSHDYNNQKLIFNTINGINTVTITKRTVDSTENAKIIFCYLFGVAKNSKF